MPNPYPANFEVAENLHVRLDGDITFTDPANQPGGGGGGQVNSVTAGDASISIGGTVTDPTVAVAALGVTAAKIASGAVTQAKLAAKAVGAAQMDSGAASANWVPVADGTGGVVYAASPGVNSLTAADTSAVVGGTAQSPTVRTGTLDTIATQHPPTAAVAMNSQKITGLANGTVASDAAAFGQIPTALPPNGSAGGDLSGTYPNPTVAAIQGVAVSGTAPTANQVLTASDATHAAWAAASGSSPLTTKGDIFGHSTVDARIPVGSDGQVLTADSAQTLGVKWAAAPGAGVGSSSLVYRYTVTGADKASIDTGVDTSAAGSNDWTNGDLLEIFITARTDDAASFGTVSVTLNNDSGANYDRQLIEGINASVSATATLGQTSWGVVAHGSGGTAGYAAVCQILIPDYAGTVFNKNGAASVALTDGTAANNHSRLATLGYRSTSAITRLAIAASAGQKLKVGSQLLVYKRLAS